MSTAQFLKRPEGRLAYDLTAGTGPLVICVPGMGDLRSEYRFLVPPLAAAGYRVATLDLRGHGESAVGFSDYSPAAIGTDVVALVDALQAPRALLVGNSMAAAASVWAAAEAPDRIAGQILLGPVVYDYPVPWLMRLIMKLLFMRPWGPAAWGMYYQSLYPTRPPADLAAHRAALVRNLAAPGRFEALQAMLAASKAPCAARLPEVRAKTLVIMGSRDPDFKDPGQVAAALCTELSGENYIVEGAGHYPHAEMPDLVAPRVLAFLGALASSFS